MYIMHSWYLYLNILKENFIIYVPNSFKLKIIKGYFKMSSKDVLKLIKDKQVEFVDLRFTDPKGKLQHLTMACQLKLQQSTGCISQNPWNSNGTQKLKQLRKRPKK